MTASPLNWFSLIGLFWLEDGDNSFGSDATNKIVMPALAHQRAGVLRLVDGQAFLVPEEGSTLRVNGRLPDSRPLRADRDGDPDLIEIGSLAMRVITRDQRLFLRVWDRDAAAARDFTELRYYPIKPEYFISAAFVPYDPPRAARIRTVIGSEQDAEFVGHARFHWDGIACRLEAQGAGEDFLFNFTDKTNGDDTYPGGRFLKAPRPENGSVTLDFNLAFNWPCAYTSFATCPIPPAENRLAVRIEAGELRYRH